MLKQFLQYKLSQKLSPQQIQLMKLIELPTQAFEQRLKQELEENPALESGKEQEDNYEDEFQTNDMDGQEISAEDINLDDYLSDDEIPEYRLNTNNHSVDDEQKTMPFASGSSFTQLLINQLNTFSLDKDQYKIAEFLIGSIDDSGYISIKKEIIGKLEGFRLVFYDKFKLILNENYKKIITSIFIHPSPIRQNSHFLFFQFGLMII